MRHLIAAVALVLASCASEPAPKSDALAAEQTIVLTGTITRADHQTYREIPFTVPPGTKNITIDFSYTGKENRTVIDIGVRDPQGQRGWSGGNKSHIEIGALVATPSYRAGPIQPGEWKLVLGIPNIREGQTASYTADITFNDDRLDPLILTHSETRLSNSEPRLPTSAGWYRGDFHTHTAHSDGSCGEEAQRQPCPTLETSTAARNAGLDFVAITDHNTMSQLRDIQQLQRWHNLLLIPGTEITTFNGHANVVGNIDFLDFQLGSPRLPTLAKLFDQVDASNAFLSINHPSLPSGEVCMGCGWTAKDTDWSRVSAIEVINGSTLRTSGPDGPMHGVKFWDELLKQGHRITAIGGSDNHDATDTTGARQSPVGKPATVVHANNLSTDAIIAAVKSGRVFVDVAGLPSATLDMQATANGQTALMGGEIQLTESRSATATVVLTRGPADAQLSLVSHNVITAIEIETGTPPDRPMARIEIVRLAPGASHGYIRPEVRDAAGKLLLLGNPIYFRRAG